MAEIIETMTNTHKNLTTWMQRTSEAEQDVVVVSSVGSFMVMSCFASAPHITVACAL